MTTPTQCDHALLTLQTLFDSCDEEVTCLTLATIGAYVSWMDITLIVNDTYIRYIILVIY